MRMKGLLAWLLALGLLAGFPAASFAQEEEETKSAEGTGGLKPLVTVSMSGFGELKNDLAWIGKAVGVPELAEKFESQLEKGPGADLVAAIDPKRPLGIVVKASSAGKFATHGFVPVKKFDDFLAALKKSLSDVGAEIEKGDGDVYEMGVGNKTIYLLGRGNWALIGDSREALEEAPKDPAEALGDLPARYDLALEASVKNVPPVWRQMALMWLQMLSQQASGDLPDESEEQAEARKAMMKQSVAQFTRLLEELDTLRLGVKADEKTSSMLLDVAITARPGTRLAKQYAAMKAAKTEFAGFMDPEALVTMNCVQKILPEDAAEGKQNMGYLRTMLTQQIEENLPDDKVALAKELTNSVLEVLEKTVDSGKTDGAGSLSVGAEGASLVLGMHVAGGEKLNGVVKRLVEMLEKEKPEAAKWIKLDAEEHAGVKFHRFSLPLSELRGPKKDELAQMRKVFGPSIDVVLGVSDQALYLGAGRDALAALKTAIDKSKESGGKLVAPAEISFSAKAVLRLVAMVAPKKDAQTAEKILKQLEGTKDKVHILAKSIPNGMEMQFELQEGVLKAIGQLAREAEGRPVGGPVKIMKRDRIKVPATQPADEDSDSDEKQ